ncbi:cytochrome P450 4p1-like [Lucilia cuprina]|uniref:cytochrome P450 4p1-like n=1 Tax=Lucilia cuprina TaxID=7375 RepID=UPI001F058050|nr:cytochrome P450 4p1-like [Lucilia cuprina]
MVFWTLAVGFILIIWLFKLNKNYHILAFFAPRIKTTDGSPVENIAPPLPGRTIFGNTFDVAGYDYVATFKYARQNAELMKKTFTQHVLGKTILNVIDADLWEIIATDTKLIKKGFVYDFLEPALGEGLLISTDQKWHARRKMLTPAFHFNILGQFEEIFKEESQKFVKELENLNTDEVLLDEVIPKLTLNVVCETALGVKLDNCLNGDEYRESFKVFEECFNKRVNTPHLLVDFIYKLLEEHKYTPAIKIVHDFSSDIIKKRRQLFQEELNKQVEEQSIENDNFDFKKKRYAMLDTLLRAEKEGLIDHAGICEEVDTFMFEGFDTTSMGLTFSLMNLSLYPEMQERCYQEIIDNIDDFDNLDISKLNNLKYMECFLKETMRLYPSVPVIMREAVQETHLANGLILPANTFISIHIFDIHRNPKHFENPNTFDPDRFTPEKSAGRHPYAFSPFSAGQRNCIGQKFAMLEMKTLLVHVIHKFKLLPLVDPDKFEFKTGIIIRTKDEVKVKLVKRQ